MKIWLIDDEEKFMRALARTKHSEMFKTIADIELQERMRRENAAQASQAYTDMLKEIHSTKQGDLINWEYLKKNNPKRYKKYLEIRQKEIEMRKAGIEPKKWITFPNDKKKKTKEVA